MKTIDEQTIKEMLQNTEPATEPTIKGTTYKQLETQKYLHKQYTIIILITIGLIPVTFLINLDKKLILTIWMIHIILMTGLYWHNEYEKKKYMQQ